MALLSRWEHHFIHWAEQQGYTMDYAANLDLEQRPARKDGQISQRWTRTLVELCSADSERGVTRIFTPYFYKISRIFL